MASSDEIKTSNTSTRIYWNDSSTSGASDCDFIINSTSEYLGWMASDGNFHSNSLTTRVGLIYGSVPPLWITDTSSTGDLVSFRKGNPSAEKLLIKNDGEIEFKDNATLSKNNGVINIENSGTSGDITAFLKNSSEKLVVASDGELQFKDNATISHSNAITISSTGTSSSSETVIKTNNTSTGNIAAFQSGTNKKLVIGTDGKLVFLGGSSPTITENGSVGLLVTIASSSISRDIVKFSADTTERMRVTKDGDLKFNQAFSIFQDDESVIDVDTAAGAEQVIIGKGDGTASGKIKEVRIGSGAGSFTNQHSILGIYPEDNGGGISFNKGNLDVSIMGYVQGTNEKALWFFTDTATTPTFKFNEQSSMSWIVRTSAPSVTNDGDIWIERSGGNIYLYIDDNGTLRRTQFV